MTCSKKFNEQSNAVKSKNKLGFLRNIFLAAIIGYYGQGALYPIGSILSQSLLVIILFISVFFLYRSLMIKEKKSLFYKAWTALLVLNIVGYIFTAGTFNHSQFGMFKGILMASLPFYPSYYFAKNNVFRKKDLIRYLFIALPILIFQFYGNIDILQDRYAQDRDLVLNISYTFVAYIPFVFLLKKKVVLSSVMMAILLFFVIIGSKRGAFITGSLGLVMFIFYHMRTLSKEYGVWKYFMLFVGLGLLGYFTYDTYVNNDFLITRLNQMDEGSGRVRIFTKIFNDWKESDSFIQLIFGNGFAASITITGSLAHNDWLELLSNFGLLGFSTYLILFYSSIKILRNRAWSAEKKILLFTVILMWFSTSLYSMGYTNISNGYLRAIMLGFLLGGGNTLK